MKMKDFVKTIRNARLKTIERNPSLKNSKELRDSERLEQQLLLMNQDKEVGSKSEKRLKAILKEYNL